MLAAAPASVSGVTVGTSGGDHDSSVMTATGRVQYVLVECCSVLQTWDSIHMEYHVTVHM